MRLLLLLAAIAAAQDYPYNPYQYYNPNYVQNYAQNFAQYPQFNHFQLPRQVRVPGRVEIFITGADAEIVCELPRFLILIQKIYWHHRFDDPYGTYYDHSQNFSPRITINLIDKYKSVLKIRNFNEDDFGTYRCLSAAILPDDDQSFQNLRGSTPVPIFARNSAKKVNKRELSSAKSVRKRSLYGTSAKIFAPYFKPSYGLYSVFSEIKFEMGMGGRGFNVTSRG